MRAVQRRGAASSVEGSAPDARPAPGVHTASRLLSPAPRIILIAFFRIALDVFYRWDSTSSMRPAGASRISQTAPSDLDIHTSLKSVPEAPDVTVPDLLVSHSPPPPSPPPLPAPQSYSPPTPPSPQPPSPPPPPSPQPQLSSPGSSKPCASGCEVRGTCNHDLGRCDCPLLTSGPTCEVSAVPSYRVRSSGHVDLGRCDCPLLTSGPTCEVSAVPSYRVLYSGHV